MIIYSKFNNLKPEKQKQIINAAIKEFVRNGFEKASTNEIVKRANISKGSLFNYFNSKKDLYLYLIEYSSKAIVNLNEEIDLSETDLFKRIERVALQKFYVQQKYPQAFEFLASTKQEETVALLSKLDVDKHIDVEIELDELDLTSAESKATYAQIKEYVWNKFELKVSTLYIAQIKKKCGIELREHYNKSKKEKQIIPQCTPEKEEAIMDALRHFKMI